MSVKNNKKILPYGPLTWCAIWLFPLFCSGKIMPPSSPIALDNTLSERLFTAEWQIKIIQQQIDHVNTQHHLHLPLPFQACYLKKALRALYAFQVAQSRKKRRKALLVTLKRHAGPHDVEGHLAATIDAFLPPPTLSPKDYCQKSRALAFVLSTIPTSLGFLAMAFNFLGPITHLNYRIAKKRLKRLHYPTTHQMVMEHFKKIYMKNIIFKESIEQRKPIPAPHPTCKNQSKNFLTSDENRLAWLIGQNAYGEVVDFFDQKYRHALPHLLHPYEETIDAAFMRYRDSLTAYQWKVEALNGHQSVASVHDIQALYKRTYEQSQWSEDDHLALIYMAFDLSSRTSDAYHVVVKFKNAEAQCISFLWGIPLWLGMAWAHPFGRLLLEKRKKEALQSIIFFPELFFFSVVYTIPGILLLMMIMESFF